jgi:hypothetical protein
VEGRLKADQRQIREDQIKEADQRRSKDQSRGTRTGQRRNVRGSEHIVKEFVVTTSEVVNKTKYQSERRLQYPSTLHLVFRSDKYSKHVTI